MTRIHCEAGTRHTRLSPSGFGFERIPCSQSVGLSNWTDRAGVVRYACHQEGHRYQVERIYGVEDPPEPDWDLDARPFGVDFIDHRADATWLDG